MKDDDAHHTISQPEAGKALVYVIQDIGAMQCYGACITSKIGVDGAWVGANHRNSYFSFALDPGEHHLCANWQSHLGRLSSVVGLTHLTAEAGKIYYYRTRAVGMGGPTFFDFEAIDSDQARLFIAQIPQSISHPKK